MNKRNYAPVIIFGLDELPKMGSSEFWKKLQNYVDECDARNLKRLQRVLGTIFK